MNCKCSSTGGNSFKINKIPFIERFECSDNLWLFPKNGLEDQNEGNSAYTHY
jgi:hypothetical protein